MRHLSQSVLAASAVLSLVVSVPTVDAAPIAYDGFDSYTAGNTLYGENDGSGFTGAWTGTATAGDITAQPKSLADTNALVDGGAQALRFLAPVNRADQGNFLSRALPDTTGTLYMSLLVRNEGGLDSGDFINFMVSDGATGNSSNALGVGIRNAGGNPFFARAGSSSNATTNASTGATLDTTFLLVAKFSKDGSTNYNRTDLYINPTSTTEPGTTDATAVFGGTGIDTLSLFNIRHFTPEAGDTLFIDELRFATTFADALVPEPGSLALLGLGALTLLRRRR